MAPRLTSRRRHRPPPPAGVPRAAEHPGNAAPDEGGRGGREDGTALPGKRAPPACPAPEPSGTAPGPSPGTAPPRARRQRSLRRWAEAALIPPALRQRRVFKNAGFFFFVFSVSVRPF